MCCSGQQHELQKQRKSCILEVRRSEERLANVTANAPNTKLFCYFTAPQTAQRCHVGAGARGDGQTAGSCQT